MSGFSSQSAYMKHVDTIVDTYGWLVQGVLPEGKTPPMAYTVGLGALLHPEVLVCGLEFATAQQILNDVGRRVLREHTFSAGDVVPDIALGYNVCFLEIQQPTQIMTVASAYQKRKGWNRLRGLQMVFPDMEHRWPWHEDSHHSATPILGQIPDSLR